LNKRRGEAIDEHQHIGAPLVTIKAYLPVIESFGLTGSLREACHGMAFPQCVFDHWQMIPGNPLEAGSYPNTIVMKVRESKGLAKVVPDADHYLDKL